jgi:stage III sporulation protein AB
MLKLTGAILVIAAGTLLGFYQASILAKRPRQIRQASNALQRLETEIAYGLTPLPDALSFVGQQTPEPLAGFYREAAGLMSIPNGGSARESWQRALQSTWHRTVMKPGTREIMSELGGTLGVSNREEQIKHIRLAVKQLQGEEESAREEQARYENMWRSLGFLTGALVVILIY